jgi:hypothetical protein
MGLLGLFSKMSYLIKHPINEKTPKFAVAYYDVSYTIGAGLPATRAMALNTLVQDTGMILSLSNNAIVLDSKNYIVYFKTNINNGSENQGCAITPLLNGAVVTVNALAASYVATTIGSASAYTTPLPYSYISLSANSGDLLSFRFQRITGPGYASTVPPDQNKVFIMEIEK